MPPTQAPRRRTSSEEKLYSVVFEGDYFCHDQQTGNRTVKPYEVEVTLNQTLVNKGPVSVFKRFIAPRVMPKKYPGFTRLHTHMIKVAKDSNGETPDDIYLLNRDDMLHLIKFDELPIKTALYDDDGQLRQAILECWEDEALFLTNQERLAARRSDTVSIRDIANELNPTDLVPPQASPTTTATPTPAPVTAAVPQEPEPITDPAEPPLPLASNSKPRKTGPSIVG